MSEQLTLEGLTNSRPQEKKKAKKTDPDITERINMLAELRGRMDAMEQKEAIVVKAEVEATKARSAALATAMVSQTQTIVVTTQTVEPLDEKRTDKKDPEVLTVSDLNRGIKALLEKSFPFVWVKGEISNFKVPGSGHWYFTLKDSGAQIRAVMFRGFAQAAKFTPSDGMEVLVRCRVTVYEPRGDYQLFCEVMEPVGFGALQVAFEKLKAKLQSEGLFDAARKRKIPTLPSRIGIITSPTGAAIRDMINVLSRRMGCGVEITILPAAVQGDKAPGEIVRQIDLANSLGITRFEVLIVGRGGGSIEDLWAFNTEEVARAVSRSQIPTISAVGHEVDFTICDFVADLRAPTPSAAAELVVKNKADLVERLRLLGKQLLIQKNRKLQVSKARLEGLAKRLIDPKRKLQDLMLRCDEWTDRLTQGVFRFFERNLMHIKVLREKLGSPEKRIEVARHRVVNFDQRAASAIQKGVLVKKGQFENLAGVLNGLSPLAILDRGYSIVKKDEHIVKSSEQVRSGDEIQIKLAQGELKSRIL